MSIIVPTITTSDPNVFATNLTKFSTFAKRIQIDASDGSFAPTNLVPLTALQPTQFPQGVTIDIHLMSARPSEHLPAILALKPSLCILHAEVDDNLAAVFAQLKQAGIKTGIAFIKTTFPGRVRELVASCDHAMVFAGTLGSQGGAIDLLQTEKIPLLRAIKPELEIGWDGGANLSNIRALAHSDLDVINVGSAISQASDPAAMYQSLLAEADKKGVLI